MIEQAYDVLGLRSQDGILAILIIGLITGAATASGGALAFRFQAQLGLFLSFSSGAIIGVALFDLLPEAFDLGGSRFQPLTITTAVAVGFALYLALDRITLAQAREPRMPRANLGPGTLTAHSVMDGLAIGFAFQVSPGIGAIVAFAVLAHDVLDGANVVTLSLAGGSSRVIARRWLLADAAAPLVGIFIAHSVAVPPAKLALLLALFAGFFLYIGASDLLPRTRNSTPRLSNLAATALGLGLVYGAVRLAPF
jgi:zinc transporter ZupT